MKWTPEDVTRAVEVLSRHSSIVEAVAEMRAWRGGLSKDALRKALELHGKLSPSAYLGTAVDEPEPTTARSAREVFLATPKSVEPARSERWRESSENLGELPDRGFVAPPSGVRRFGRPGERWAFIPDTHVPYHDEAAWRLALAAVKAARVDGICILGDFLDCYSVSFHSKSPGRVSRLADEVSAARECLDQLEAAAPSATRVFVEGNHEHRVSRYIASQAAALHGLVGLTLREAMRLDSWAWVPYHEHCTIGDTSVTHEAGRAGIYAVRQTMLHMGSSLIIGHVHRFGSVTESTLDGRQLSGHAFGWLGDPKAVDYRHRALAAREWQHGIGLGVVGSDGRLHCHGVPFGDGVAVVFGEEVKAR